MVFHHYNVGTAVLCYIMTGLGRVCSVDPNSKSPAKEKRKKQIRKAKYRVRGQAELLSKFRPFQRKKL